MKLRLFYIVFVIILGVFLFARLEAQTAVTKPDAGSVNQAEAQHNGEFPELRRGAAGGQIQDAWNGAPKDAGISEFDYCRRCTYKLVSREHMVTMVELPEGEIIERIDMGDGDEFVFEKRGDNRLSVKPLGYGIDSNIIVHGASGQVYPFYIRSEKYNSGNISDFYVQIKGRVKKQTNRLGVDFTETVELAALRPPQTSGGGNSQSTRNDYVEQAAFNPASIHGWDKYKLYGGGPDPDGIKPETVFRDDRFSYLKYGRKWTSSQLPVAYVVVDGIDEVINTRVMGDVLVVESLADVITLKNGSSYICVKWEGGK